MANTPDKIRIQEIYPSIQGESSYAGLSCVFVRTSGCPFRCTWCDTEYAFGKGEEWDVKALAKHVLETYEDNLIEVTGGEPLQQKATLPLLKEFCDAGRTVLLETSGLLSIEHVDPRVHVILDVKCPSSGEEEKNVWQNMALIKPTDEVKFVLGDEQDMGYAYQIIREFNLQGRCKLLFSTVFEGGAELRRKAVDWMLYYGLDGRFQLQMHKYIWAPDTQGV